MGIGIDEYREFVVLANCLNFTKAAEQLYVSQSSLSKHIANIEKEFGAQLFLRDRRMVELTDAGRIVLEGAISMVNAFDSTRKALADHAKRQPIRADGILYDQTISGIISLASGTLTRDGFSQLILGKGGDRPFVDMLREGEIDVALCYAPVDVLKESGLATIPLTLMQFMAVVDIDSPFASRSSISIEELRDETFVRFVDAYAASGWARIEHVCRKHGFTPKQRPVVASAATYSMTMPDGDVLIQPSNIRQLKYLEESSSVAIVPVNDRDAHFVIDCIYRRADEEHLSEFLTAIKDARERLFGRVRESE